jgi:hypothetical protein
MPDELRVGIQTDYPPLAFSIDGVKFPGEMDT